MDFQIDHLFKNPQHTRLVATWIYNEFWIGKPGYSVETFETLMDEARDPDRIPLSLIALVDGQPVGTVNLIENDSPSRPHLRPWLTALVVLPEYRLKGIGSALVRALVDETRWLRLPQLFLGTDLPGFYTRLGAELNEQVTDTLCIMRIPLTA